MRNDHIADAAPLSVWRARAGAFALGALCLSLASSGGEAVAQSAPGGGAAAASAPAISYTIVDGVSIPEPLTKAKPNVERGEALFLDPAKGGCADCHAAPGVDVKPTRSGPALDGVGARLSASAIRLWIVNPRAIREETTMPAYYSLNTAAASPGAPRNAPPRSEPRLDGESIEDLVAFLESLK